MSLLKIGIIGTGSIADNIHGPTVNKMKGVELVAVFSREIESAKSFLNSHGVNTGTVYNCIESFCKDESVDLVIICTPDKLHASQALRCLENGKHVLLEKPMTVSLKEAEELVKEAAKRDLQLAIGYHLQSHVGHQLLRNKIKAGSIGILRHIRIIWAFPQENDKNWRAHDVVGKWWSLAAVGTHCLDLARWFSDNYSDWKSLNSTVSNSVWNGPHDESALVTGEFDSGVTVDIVSSVQFGPYDRIEIFGSEGHAICKNTLNRFGNGSIKINDVDLEFEPESPFETQLERLISCIQSGEHYKVDGDVGLRGVKDLLLVRDV